MRALPDFLIIGAQRCGTSSLYKYLSQHPHVVGAVRKEVEYFSTRYPEGERWYRSHFPIQRLLSRRQTFEATPDYLLDPRAPKRVADLIPGTRLVVLLRDPVERSWSHYLHNRRLLQEPLEFDEALRLEGNRLSGEMDKLMTDPGYLARPLRRYSYVTRGLYAEQMERWLDVFRREQMIVIRSEDLFSDPASTLKELLDFLQLSSWEPKKFANYSYRGNRPASVEMLPSIRRHLVEVFTPLNRQLTSLLGRDMAWPLQKL